MRPLLTPILGLLFTGLPASPAVSGPTTTPLVADRDAWLKESTPAEKHGADPELSSKNKAGDNFRPVFHFDLSTLPGSRTIASAQLVLHVTAVDTDAAINVHRMTSAWAESTVTWASSATDVDSTTIYGSFLADSLVSKSVDVTELVREWYGGSKTNFGLMLLSTSADIEAKFASREWGTNTERPILVVETVEKAYRVASGTYVGNGALSRTIGGLGFTPSFVIVKADDNEGAVARSSTMSTGLSKPLASATSMMLGGITALRGDGFRLGSSLAVNGSGITYYWVAFADESSYLKVGSYLGNGVDDRAIGGVGFTPGFVVVMGDGPTLSVKRYGSHVGDASLPFDDSAELPDRIQDFLLSGFQLGTDPTVNSSGLTYHYVAFKEVAGTTTNGGYTGNGQDDRNITTNSQPEYVIVERNGSGPRHRPAALLGDATLPFGLGGSSANAIQTLLSNGFQLGSANAVNQINKFYHYMAFADPGAPGTVDIRVAKISDIAVAAEADTVTFTITASNNGPSGATGVSLTDNLPAGLTYLSDTPSQGNYDNGTGTWTIGALAKADSATLDLATTVDAGAAGSPVVNLASLLAVDQTENNSTNDADSVTVQLPLVNLTIGTTAGAVSAEEGDTVSFNVLVTNAGPDPATTVRILNTLPAGLTAVSDSTSQGSYDSGTGLWTVGTLGNGALEGLVIQATVDAGTAPAWLVDTATITTFDGTDSSAGDNTSSDSTFVELAGFQITTGSYAGNGLGSQVVTGLGFTPDVVMVKGDNGLPAYARTSDMLVTESKSLGAAAAPQTARITSFGPDRFTLGSSGDVNGFGPTYHWVAMKADSAHLAVGTYTGNLADDRAINGVGFEPGYLAIFADDAQVAIQRFSQQEPDSSLEFPAGSGELADRIQDFLADGFEIGTHPTVNASGVEYFYAAFNDASPFLVTEQYTGDGTDDRAIEGAVFSPGAVFLRGDGGTSGTAWRSESMGLDYSLLTDTGGAQSNAIQQFLSEGFEIGTGGDVNSPGTGYHWAAIQDADGVSGVDIVVTKTVDVATPAEADTVRFTIEAENRGPFPATGISVTDLLPAGLTYAADSTSQGTYDPGTGLWTVGAVAQDDAAGLVLTATVDAGTAGTSIMNNATLTSVIETDNDTSNDADSVAVTIPGADLAVTKSVDDSTPPEGATIAYTIHVENKGPDAASGVAVTDLLPAGVTYTADSTNVGTYNSGTGLWGVGAIAVGDTAALVLTATVDASTEGNFIDNSASVTAVDQDDASPGDETDSAAITVTGTIVLDNTVTTAKVKPPVANQLVWSHTVSAGTDRILLVNVSFRRIAQDSITGVIYAGQPLTRIGSAISPDTNKKYRADIWALVAPPVGTDNVTVSFSGSDGVDAVVGGSASFTGVSQVTPFGTPVANSGNTGTGPPSVVVTSTDGDLVVDVLAIKGDNFNSISADAGQVELWNDATGNNDVLHAMGGSSREPGAASVTMSWSVSSLEQWALAAVPLKPSATPTDLALTKVVNDPTPNEGDSIVYTITATNNGPGGATGIDVTDVLPAGLTYASDSTSQGSYDSGTGVWAVGGIPAAGAASLFLTATVDAGTNGTSIMNNAAITAVEQDDPTPGDEADSVAVAVESADLEVTKTVDGGNPNEGGSIVYTVRIVNAGPDGATGVTLTDLLPAGVTYSADSTSQGTYTDGTGLWTVGSIATADTASLFLTATVDAGTGGTSIMNNAAVTAVDQADPTTGNEADSAAVAVQSADLAVTKSVDDATPNEGDSIVYTVRIVNAGPDGASGVALIDLLPAGVTYSADSTSQGTYADGTGLWTAGSIAAADTASLFLTATVDAGTGGTDIMNNASISAVDQADPATGNEADSVAVSVQSADLVVTKAVDDVMPNEGDSIVYTVRIVNGGPDGATGVALIDLLPGGVTYSADSTSQGTYIDGTGLWTVGAIAATDTASLFLTATVDTGTGGTSIMNNAAISAVDQTDPAAGNEADSVAISIESADLGVTKTVDDATPNEGDSIVYTVRIVNAGPDAATGVNLTDLLPVGVTFSADSASHGIYTEGNGLWNVGGIAAADTASLFLTATVDAGTGGTSIMNNAAITAVSQADPASGNEADSVAITVASADLVVTKSVDDASPNEGDSIVYTVRIVNAGPDGATAVTLTDLLPAGVTYSADSTSQGTYASGTGLWTVGSIAAADTASLFLTVGVDAGTGGTSIMNNAAVTAVDQADPTTGNEADSAAVAVQSADLAVTKTVDDASPNEGGSIVYTVRIVNAGPDGATGVTLTDLLPAGVTYSADSTSQGTYASGTGLWTVGSIAAADTASLFLTATVDAGTGGTSIINNAAISAVDQADPTIGNEADSVAITVASADLVVTKSVDDASPNEGDSIVYTVRIVNAGPDGATAVTLTDLLPAGVTYSADSTSQGTYASGTGLWTVGSIAAADTASLFLTVGVDAGTGGTSIMNNAAITAVSQADPASGNEADSVAITVESADLVVTKTVDDASPNEGGSIVYTVRIVNAGPAVATGVTLTDLLPAGVTYSADSTSEGSYASGTGLWTVGSIAAADTASLFLTATVDAGTGGTSIINNAAISAVDQADPTTGNEADSVAITVASADLVVTKSVDDASPNEGDSIVYTVRIVNAGPDGATAVTLTDLLPAGVTYSADSTSQGTYASGTGLWTVGSIAAADTASLFLTATVDAGTGGTSIINNAAISAVDQADPTTGNEADSVAVSIESADLVVTKTVGNASPNEGDSIVYTVRIVNAGPSAATGIVLADTLQTGISFISSITSQGTWADSTGLWTVGTLAAADTATLSITAAVGAGTAGTTIPNTAAVSSVDQTDPAGGNEADSVDVTVRAADLALAKTVDDATPTEGDPVSFSIVLTNGGPSAATGVSVTDLLPGGLTYASDSTSQGTYTNGSGLWNVGTVAAGDTAFLRVDATVDAGTGGSAIQNLASVTAVTEADPAPGSEGDSVSVVIQAAELAVTKTVGAPDSHPGATVRFTVDVSNSGPHAASGVTIADALPAGLTYAADSTSEGSFDPGAGTWTLGGLSASGSATLWLDATVDSGTVGSTLWNFASLAALDQAELDASNDVDSASVAIFLAPAIAVREITAPATISEGQTGVTMQLRLENLGSDPVGVDSLALTFMRSAPGDMDAAFSVTPDAGNPDSLAAATSGWFSFDVGLLPAATSGNVTVDGAAAGSDSRFGANLLDVGSDSTATTLIQIPPDLDDEPNTLDPPASQPGASTSFSIAFTNAGEVEVTLDGSSRLRIAAPGDTLDVPIDLGVPAARRVAADTTLTFGPASIPADFPVGMHPMLVELAGTDANGSAYAEAFTAADSLVVVDEGVTAFLSQPTIDVLPGEANVLIATLGLASSENPALELQQVRFENATSGAGTAAQLDADLGTVTLWIDDGDGSFDSRTDTRWADAIASGSVITLAGTPRTIPPGALAMLHVSVSPGLAARDGDVLDVTIPGASSIVFDRSTTFFQRFPLDPDGALTVDGMSAAQVTASALPVTGVVPGHTALALDVVIPANGYEADVLEEIGIVNLGDAVADDDLAGIALWADGGDGSFDAGTGDDTALGATTWTGSEWELTGLALPLPEAGARIWAGVLVDSTATSGRTIRLAIGANALTVTSDNDGPRDASAQSPTTITVQSSLSDIAVLGVEQTGATLLPGEDGVEVFRFALANLSAVAETLSAITFTNRTTGPGSQAELDAEWLPLSLGIEGSVDAIGIGGARAANPAFSAGQATFSGLAVAIAPGDTTSFTVRSGASLLARDGDVLDLTIESGTDLAFTRAVRLDGPGDTDLDATFPVDGMAAAQISLGAGVASNLLTGSARNLAFDLLVPANGYETDTLRVLSVANTGDTRPDFDISRVEAWLDADTDGAFEPDGDDAGGLLGDMIHTGSLWQITGLQVPVPAGGARVFVSVDVAEQADESRVVRLALPSSPDVGLTMESANDGPRDRFLESPSGMTITQVDRVALASEAISPGGAAPGSRGLPLVHLRATNLYSVPRTLTGLTVRNLSTGPGSQAELDSELSRLSLRADADSNGVLDPSDPLLAVALFAGGSGSFGGFSWTIPADVELHLFVTGDVSLSGAADGDVLSADIQEAASLAFQDATTKVSASFPLDSGSAWTVNGMVASQLGNHGAPVATVGPTEGPIAALDVTIPANGYRSDILRGLRVENLGTAVPADLADLRLWRDDGDAAFTPSTDNDLGSLTYVSGSWTSASLSESLVPGGARLFVSFTASATPTDSATVRFAIPANGLTMDSANDGPLDTAVANPETQLLSSAVLLANLEIDPALSTVSQTVTLRMFVRNLGDSTITGIAPSALVPSGTGTLTALGPATPPSFDLVPGADSVFVWSFSADSAGTARFTASASGTEVGTGQARQSLAILSNEHEVFTQATDLTVFPVESMPFSLSRGQTSVVPLSLTLTNDGDADASAVRLLGLRVRIEDEGAGDVVPADLFSRVVVNEGTNVYLEKTSMETSGSVMNLTLTEAVRIDSQGSSGEQVTLSLSLDIADSTTVPSFRLLIEGAASFDAQDATNGAPVTVGIDPGESYPIQSGLARVVAEATRLDVALVPGSEVPFQAGRGQEDVRLLSLRVVNPGPAGLGADARISSFAVTLVDSVTSAPLAPFDVLESIRVRTSVQTLADRAVTVEDDTTLALVLSPLLSIPVVDPQDVFVEGTIRSDASLGTVRLRMAHPGNVDVRDANTGNPLPVLYETDPLRGADVTVLAVAETLEAGGVARFPAVVSLGETAVPALDLTLAHPGTFPIGSIRCDSLVIRCFDQSGQAVAPASYLDRARVTQGGTEIGLQTNMPSSGGEFTIPLTNVVLTPGGSRELSLEVDFEVTAPASFFEMRLQAGGVFACDANLFTPVEVVAPGGSSLPLTSGVTRLAAPARELALAAADRMPASLVADGSPVDAMLVTLRNPAVPPASDIVVGEIQIDAAGRDLEALGFGQLVARVTVEAGEISGDSGDLSAEEGNATVVFANPLRIPAGESVELAVRLTPRDGTSDGSVRIGVTPDNVGVIQPESSLLTVSVVAENGQTFPFWTEPGNFAGVTLADSYSNYPNPFAAGRQETRFAFFLREPASVSLQIWTPRGALVRSLLTGEPRPGGMHQETGWDGRNGRGDVVRNGVYVAEILATFADGSSERVVRKVAVVR